MYYVRMFCAMEKKAKQVNREGSSVIIGSLEFKLQKRGKHQKFQSREGSDHIRDPERVH